MVFEMTFEAIPAVDLKGGRCVQLVQGKPGTELVSLPDPVSSTHHFISFCLSTAYAALCSIASFKSLFCTLVSCTTQHTSTHSSPHHANVRHSNI